MATLYYNGAVDTAWDTLGNWWQDAAYTVPATNTPVDADIVYIDAEMDTGPSINDVYLFNIIAGSINTSDFFYFTLTGTNQAFGSVDFFNQAFSSSTGTIVGDVTLYGGSNVGYVTGNATVYGVNIGYIAGNADFYGYGMNAEYTGYTNGIGGTATFHDFFINAGGVGGDAIFNDYSENGYGVSGNAIFNDFSLNGLVVTGSATFNHSSSNQNSATILGGAIFNDNSYNNTQNSGYGGFSGDIIFNDNSYTLSPLYGTPVSVTFKSNVFFKSLPSLIGVTLVNYTLTSNTTLGSGIYGSSILGMS